MVKVRLTVWLEEKLIKEAKKYAIDRGLNYSELVAAALKDFLKKKK